MPEDGLHVTVIDHATPWLMRLFPRITAGLEETAQVETTGFVREVRSTPYPPPPENSKYARTYILKTSWGIRKIKPLTYRLDNLAGIRKGNPYAGLVVGDEKGQGQAYMHVGRWWKIADKVKEFVPKLRRAYVATIGRIIRR
jgi:hypothetical protein